MIIKNYIQVFQTSKELRKKFKKIKLNFNYNLLTNELKIDNFYVDDKYSENINQYLMDANKEQNNIKNWIDFKKYINEIIFLFWINHFFRINNFLIIFFCD